MLMDRHMLTAESGGIEYDYCSGCSAFRYADDPFYDGGSLPSGTDPVANRAAWDAADTASPEDLDALDAEVAALDASR